MTTARAGAKSILREEALARRGALSASARAAFAARLADEGAALVERFAAQAVSAYYPIGAEPDTLPLLARLAARGTPTLLPITMGRGMALVFRAWRPGEPLARGAMNIPEPLAEAPTRDPDLLFTPLACFDRRGERIGYGAGHYDRTLAALRARGRMLAIGVAYSVSECDALPHEPYDQRLDFVLTERELIDCRND